MSRLEEEFELQEIFAVIRKRWVIIVLIPLLALLASAYISYFYLTPQYKASTTLMVLHEPAEFGYDLGASDISFSRQLVTSYGEIVKSRRVAERAVAMAGEEVRISPMAMRDKIDVNVVGDTEFINISVTDNDPEIAAYWTNLVTEAFKTEVSQIMRVENVSLLDEAIPPENPVSPNPALNMSVAVVLGLMVALGLSFLLEFMDRTIKIPKDVTNSLQLPTLGAVPNFSKNLKKPK